MNKEVSIIKPKKAQASLEFMSTYVWVLITVLVTVGVLFYFNVFDPQKYVPEKCEFGQNIVCHDWSIKKPTQNTFQATLKLRNNLERAIEIVDISVLDSDLEEIVCSNANLSCPFDSTQINWSINNPSYFNGTWSVGKYCSLRMNCDKFLVKNAKDEIHVSITFRRKTPLNDSTNHTITGKVFSRVQ